MTPEQLDDIEARAEAATDGPWEADHRGTDVHETNSAHGDLVAEAGLTPADARFIAHARTDVPALVAVVERQRAAITAVRHITRNADHRESQVPALIDEALDDALREEA